MVLQQTSPAFVRFKLNVLCKIAFALLVGVLLSCCRPTPDLLLSYDTEPKIDTERMIISNLKLMSDHNERLDAEALEAAEQDFKETGEDEFLYSACNQYRIQGQLERCINLIKSAAHARQPRWCGVYALHRLKCGTSEVEKMEGVFWLGVSLSSVNFATLMKIAKIFAKGSYGNPKNQKLAEYLIRSRVSSNVEVQKILIHISSPTGEKDDELWCLPDRPKS